MKRLFGFGRSGFAFVMAFALALALQAGPALASAWEPPAGLSPDAIATSAGTKIVPYITTMITAGLVLIFCGAIWRLISRKGARIGR